MKEECQVFTRGEYVPNAWGDVPTVLDMPMPQSGLQQCFRIVLNSSVTASHITYSHDTAFSVTLGAKAVVPQLLR